MTGSIRFAGCSDQGRALGSRAFPILLGYVGFILREERADHANTPLIMLVRRARPDKSCWDQRSAPIPPTIVLLTGTRFTVDPLSSGAALP